MSSWQGLGKSLSTISNGSGPVKNGVINFSCSAKQSSYQMWRGCTSIGALGGEESKYIVTKIEKDRGRQP